MWAPKVLRFYRKLESEPYLPTYKFFQTASTLSPLDGIRVLDLSRIIAGPYCSMILGDLGAEIIKVEETKCGDECRRWGSPVKSSPDFNCYFISVNRNKKSICVNFKTSRGQEILYALAKKSDVLLENYTPGVLDKYNLGYEQVKKAAPKLIYCSITGYGSKGPYRYKPGYDVIAASIGGLLNITGPKDGEPCKVGVPVTDMMTGLYAHGAIMAALLLRNKTGVGQKVECDLLSTQLSTLINIGSNYLNAGLEATRWGTAHVDVVPYQVFETKNGHITLGTGSDKQFVCLCEMMGLPQLATDERFSTNSDRLKNRGALIPMIQNQLVTKTTEEWLDIFQTATFPHAPVNTISQVFKDPHVQEIGIVKDVNAPSGGKLKIVGPPVQYSDSKNEIRMPPPLLGQHTDEILGNILQLSKDQIEILRTEGHIR